MSETARTAPRTAVDAVLERYEAVIGIEIHCQLRTNSKMFCGCSTAYDGAAPNTHCCPVCLGLPGALPVINRQAVEYVIATGLAISAQIPERTQWERKNYFYPDLPKGYQISQYAIPLAAHGLLPIETAAGPFTVEITRAHLEEDTAKLLHGDAATAAASATGARTTLVDFNRSGAPLMEIVTEPTIRTGEQARRYAEELQLLLRAIGVSDADMERGQMRVEANVSLRPRGTEPFGTRVEVKNMNSFRSVERAIAYEIERQGHALDHGEPLVMETRGWDEGRQLTYRMRAKETSEDYRYFPEPDLPPLRVDAGWVAAVNEALPELPSARRARYVALGLGAYDAAVITADPDASRILDSLRSGYPELSAKVAANWIIGEYMRLKRKYPDGDAVFVSKPDGLGDIIKLVVAESITPANAKAAFEQHFAHGLAVAAIVGGMTVISDDAALLGHIDAVIAANPRAVADHKAGKPVAGFLTGQVMKATGGAANAARVTTLVRERLDREG